MLASVVPLGSLGGEQRARSRADPEPAAAVDRLVAWRLPDPESAVALGRGVARVRAHRGSACAGARARDGTRAESQTGAQRGRGRRAAAQPDGPGKRRSRTSSWRFASGARSSSANSPSFRHHRRQVAFSPAGRSPRQVLESALRLPTRANATAELAAASRRPRWRAPLERFAAGDDLAGLQRAFEADRVRWAVGLFLGGDPLGVDIPIAYALAVENEARNLRLVGEAAAAHEPADAVRPLLLLPGDGEAWAA